MLRCCCVVLQFNSRAGNTVISVVNNLATRNTPDPYVYVLSGCIPVEGQIDLKALTFFNNFCRQDESSLEKQIAYRQLTIKSDSSVSWLTP